MATEAIAINYLSGFGLWQWSHTATDSTVTTGSPEAQVGALNSAQRAFPYFPRGSITIGAGPTAASEAGNFTLTYSATSATVANVTSTAVGTTGSTNTVPYGYTSAAQADSIPVAINANAADILVVKQNLNKLINDTRV